MRTGIISNEVAISCMIACVMGLLFVLDAQSAVLLSVR